MLEEGISTLVFLESTLTTGFPTSKLFPMLQIVPLVDKETWVGGFPLSHGRNKIIRNKWEILDRWGGDGGLNWSISDHIFNW